MAPIKLFFITPALTGGGIERSTPVLIELLGRFTKSQISWIGINRSEYREKLDGVSITSMTRESGDGFVATARIIRELRDLIVLDKRSIVIANGEVAELLALALPRRIPIICVEHASRPWLMNRKLGFLVRKLLVFKAATWITVNSEQESIWPGIRNFEIVLNPIYPTSLNEDDLGTGLIHVGRVTPDKGTDMVCIAAKLLKVCLDVYGEGEELFSLRSRYSNVEGIKFHGFVENIWNRIGPRRLLISASLHEGDGRNIAEAIMRQQPLLLLDTRDHRRFKLPEVNYFSNLDALVSRVEEHKVDDFERLRPAKSFAEREKQKRNPSNIADSWISLISKIAAKQYQADL